MAKFHMDHINHSNTSHFPPVIIFRHCSLGQLLLPLSHAVLGMRVALQGMRAAKAGGSEDDMLVLEEIPLPVRRTGAPRCPRTP